MNNRYRAAAFGLWCTIISGLALADSDYVYKAGDPSLQEWLLPAVPYPKNNAPSAERASLGKMLFFDPRLSGDGNMSCATCHSPLFGWSDGLPTAKGFKSKVLGRASPTVTNTAYNHLQMWDGRKKSLEDQAIGPMLSSAEMNVDLSMALRFLQNNATYVAAFERAYPGQGITDETLAMAIANFERTVISNNSPFDRWIKGDAKAMTAQQVNGFKLFVDPAKGNCAVCHSAPNFTDNGFHNIGLDSWGMENPDMGRYAIKPIGLMKGAFKTPTLRDITLTAPYFHDGSAMTLKDVVDHYETGGTVTTNLSPNMKKLSLSQQEKADLVEFMKALTTPPEPFALPVLPPNTF
ncbi:cytochrome-c peroxidase [Ketobacter sp.]|uniref:cytochrome-c peroxidase n=1 Tax=Ketobacter sp. TaxID=2083498 RepID=UPI000F164FAE|nr:cytochrome c peroxidase [Ketobacter sp.]RLT95038.1 MAG: tryptophan tryptophylquinone biosynthesis enzyme MauG [Ketobacter sp.]